jgi:glycerophosphoryl diester phosphodiesterase
MYTLIRSAVIALLLIVSLVGSDISRAQESNASPIEIHRIDPASPQELRHLLRPSPHPLPFVSAHRGGATKGYPENCIATFEHTLSVTPSLLEIDPRYAANGAIVVHHDATLDRTTTGKGPIRDMSIADLKSLRLKDPSGTVTEFTIPTLDEVIRWAKGKTILVLDQKDVPTRVRVQKISEHQAEAYVMIIANTFKDAVECHSINPNVMMEVMIPSLEKAEQFDKLGIPWQHVIAFVGHVPPKDRSLCDYIHSKGASCMVGSSRNVDRKWIEGQVSRPEDLEADYRTLLSVGADIVETDIPTVLGPMLTRVRP